MAGGHVVADLHQRGAVHHGIGRETGDAKVMLDGLGLVAGVPAEMPGAVQQRPGGVGRRTAFTGQPAVGPARVTFAAAGQESHGDPFPLGEIGDLGAGLDDQSGRLVTEQHGHGPGPVAVDHGQVGVAQARGLDPDEHLGGAGGGEVELADGDGGGPGVRPGASDLLEDCSGDLHGVAFLTPTDMFVRNTRGGPHPAVVAT